MFLWLSVTVCGLYTARGAAVGSAQTVNRNGWLSICLGLIFYLGLIKKRQSVSGILG